MPSWLTAITSRMRRCSSRARETRSIISRPWRWRWWKGRRESRRLSGSAQIWFSPNPLMWSRQKARYELLADCCARAKGQNPRQARQPKRRSQRRQPWRRMWPPRASQHRSRLWRRPQRQVSRFRNRRHSRQLWPLFPPRSATVTRTFSRVRTSFHHRSQSPLHKLLLLRSFLLLLRLRQAPPARPLPPASRGPAPRPRINQLQLFQSPRVQLRESRLTAVLRANGFPRLRPRSHLAVMSATTPNPPAAEARRRFYWWLRLC